MRNRILALAFSVLPVLLLTGCGGAGVASTPADAVTAGPEIEGVILDVDGETALVKDVALVLDETGEQAASDATGYFNFANCPQGDVTISLAGEQSQFQHRRGADDAGGGGGDGDGCDRSDGGVRIRGVLPGEQIRLELRIQDGRVVEAGVTRRDRDRDRDGGGTRQVEIEMRPTEDNDDEDMEGEIEFELDAEGCRKLEIEVENATPEDVLVAVVIDPDEDEDSLGRVEVEADGDAEWRLNTCDGDDLPFEAETFADLAGHVFEVRDADGTALLRARLPDLPPDHDCHRIRGAARLRSLVDPVRGYVLYKAIVCDDVVRRQYFEVTAYRVRHGREVEFFLEDPDDPGTLASIGTVIADKRGVARVTFDTKDGDDLPHGAETLRALVGMDIEVRDDVSGDTLLVGTVPPPLDN